ncbi:lipid-A-disaccharide synthase [Alcanivorax sp. 1008]|uniref:lipid-A-disaccharide synthase n=1 Tax=Alcanivorax sp. 1008 TaxID=2816853 RepID=UPI001DFF540E|nr:lipid-A-disaccharide synthase [Alcanivorax sp. 1008]MCC1495557.1 lipid-A-disaccharide synthase [Alcanivorax sp. 1008]
MASTSPLVALVAGEQSGDILGAGLMAALRQRYPGVRFIGVGGSLMAEQGLESFFPMERLSVMGITEVLGRLPELFRLRRQLVDFLLQQKPDVCIGIDAPDFNLGIERRLRQAGIRTTHYVSPSVWAWRKGRVKGIRASVDLMLALLPFEAQFYRDHDVPVEFVGHPLADKIPMRMDAPALRAQLNLPMQRTIISVLPGSRGGEVKALWPTFLKVIDELAARRPELHFVVPAANPARRQQIDATLAGQSRPYLTVIDGHSREAMAASDLVLLASGTATLEALLVKRPMVIAYRVGWITYWIARSLAVTDIVGLPNLLAGQTVVPEVIQGNMTADNLIAELELWLDAPQRAAELVERFDQIHQQLSRNASERAAAAVSALMEQE